MSIVVYLKGASMVYWAYPTMVGVYFILAPRKAVVLTSIATLAITPAIVDQMEVTMFISAIMTLVVNNLFAFVFASRMHKQQEELKCLVRRDPLTGAGNRRALDEKLGEIILAYKRTPLATSLIVIDVDYFKSINDNFGHVVGDLVLIKLSDLIDTRIRSTDGLYRLGGEKFVIVAFNANRESAKGIAEDLRAMVETNNFIDERKVTISLGVVELNKDESSEEWLARGDQAMYQAKEAGCNRSFIA